MKFAVVEPQQQVEPVTITLETQDEIDFFSAIIGCVRFKDIAAFGIDNSVMTGLYDLLVPSDTRMSFESPTLYGKED
jgi:hypothetical protein